MHQDVNSSVPYRLFNFVYSSKIKQLHVSSSQTPICCGLTKDATDSQLIVYWLASCVKHLLFHTECLTLFTQIKLSNSPTACVSEGCHEFTTDCVLVASCVKHLFDFVYSNKIKQLPIWDAQALWASFSKN